MRLRFWSCRSLVVRYDTELGRGVLIPWPLRNSHFEGWAWYHDWRWHALRKGVGPSLVLQIEGIVFPLSEIVDMSLKDLLTGRRVVEARARDGKRLVVEYWPPSQRLWNKGDVTYDGLDEEMDDFYVRASSLWADPTGQESLAQWLGNNGTK